MRGKIVVYSLVGCPHCIAAKKRLEENQLPFTEVGVDRSPVAVREWLARETGRTSLPQIFFNRRHIGGNKELEDIFEDEAKKAELLEFLETTALEDGALSDYPLLPHPDEAPVDTDDDGEVDCQRDPLAELLDTARREGVFTTHRRGLLCRSVPETVTGANLLAWLQTQPGDQAWVVTPDQRTMEARDLAVSQAQALLDKWFITSLDQASGKFVADGSLYRLGGGWQSALNTAYTTDCVVGEAGKVSENIRNLTLKLFTEFVSEDGKLVDYKNMPSSPLWPRFKLVTSQLQRLNISSLSRDERIAFFINIYNVLVIHGFVEKEAPNNHYQRYKFYSSTAYVIGGHWYSLNDIENGILRGNKASMATLYSIPFKAGDPRLEMIVEGGEPRIHFALNCGARSCPPIKTFSGQAIDEQLDLATRSFLEGDDAFRIDLAGRHVQLTQLLKWYALDFGTTNSAILNWISPHLGETAARELEKVQAGGEPRVSYLPYDWSHNAK